MCPIAPRHRPSSRPLRGGRDEGDPGDTQPQAHRDADGGPVPGRVAQPPRAPAMPKSGGQPRAPRDHLPGPRSGPGAAAVPRVEGTCARSSFQPAGSRLRHGTARPGCRPGIYGAAPFPGTFPHPPQLGKTNPNSSPVSKQTPSVRAWPVLPHPPHCRWEREPAAWPGSGQGPPRLGPATVPHQAEGSLLLPGPTVSPSLSPVRPGNVPGAGVTLG